MSIKTEISGEMIIGCFKAYELRIEVVNGRLAEVRYRNGKRMAVQRFIDEENF